MIDLRCDRCLDPLSAHQPFGQRCRDGGRGGPFVLMDSERARELHVERARATNPDRRRGEPKRGPVICDA